MSPLVYIHTVLRTVDSIFISRVHERDERCVVFFAKRASSQAGRKNGESRLTRCAPSFPHPPPFVLLSSPQGSRATSFRVSWVSAITSIFAPLPPLIVSSRSTPSSIDVISRWSLDEYILWLRRITNKLNICFNSSRCCRCFSFLQIIPIARSNICILHVNNIMWMKKRLHVILYDKLYKGIYKD